MLVALGLGLLLAQTLRGARWTPGLTFASQTVLRIGIALLGFRVTLVQLTTLGWSTVAIVIIAILCVFTAAWLLARLPRVGAHLGAWPRPSRRRQSCRRVGRCAMGRFSSASRSRSSARSR